MTTMLYGTSEEIKLLAPPQNHALLPEHVSAPGLVSVTALFGNDVAHDAIDRFIDLLCEKVGADIQVQVRHWTYHELQHLRPGKVAADLAEQTDILLLVTHVDEVLPVAVACWVSAWLQQASPSSAAVCLVGSSDGATTRAPVARNLQNACQHAQVEFFASAFRVQRPKGGRLRLSICGRLGFACPGSCTGASTNSRHNIFCCRFRQRMWSTEWRWFVSIAMVGTRRFGAKQNRIELTPFASATHKRATPGRIRAIQKGPL